jgi:hypothetical protein
LITVEAHHDGGAAAVAAAVEDLAGLLADYQPDAEVRPAVLSAADPAFS